MTFDLDVPTVAPRPAMPAPTHCAPDLGGPSDGTKAATAAKVLLGVDLMEWQRLVLDRGLQRDPDTGIYRHRTVVVTVPRQNGKSVLVQSLMAERVLQHGTTSAMTAQSLQAARSILFDPLAFAFERLSRDDYGVKVRHAAGQESLTLQERGSRVVVLSPSEKSGHGYSLDLAVVDEAWVHGDLRLAQALGPTQIARPNPQLWIVSTAGTAASLWLRQMVEAGEAGEVAYFCWTSPPEHDAADPASWAEANPAYGATITEAALRAAYQSMSESEFVRAHLNRWTAGDSAAAIPLDKWLACQNGALTVSREAMAFGFDVSADRKWSAIGAASMSDGRLVVELIDHRAGTEWVLPRLIELRDRHSPAAIVGNDAGQARAMIADAGPMGLDVDALGTGRYVSACQRFYDAVIDGRAAHRGQDDVTQAIRDSTRRPLAGSWVWAAGSPRADISPLVAVTLAGSAAATPPSEPQLITG
jgi:hypothetical protein